MDNNELDHQDTHGQITFSGTAITVLKSSDLQILYGPPQLVEDYFS